MGYKEFQLLIIFWNLGLVDTFSVLKLCVNSGSQYMGVVLSSAAGNYSDLGITSLLEPILGLGTSYQFVQAAATAVERRQRISTLASFLAASAPLMSQLQPHERISNQQLREVQEIEARISQNSSYLLELNENQLSLLSRANNHRHGIEQIEKMNQQNSSSENLDSEL